jgi:hypothetical protein
VVKRGSKSNQGRPVLWAAAISLFVGNAVNGEKQFKGTEVYPWKLNGELVFTVLPGTNRLKSCEEVRNPKAAMNIAALEKKLAKLDEGEYVFFMGAGQLSGCALAKVPADIKKRLTKFAADKKLQLNI